jgi:long-chain acyl-CoA synthetase
MEKHSKDLLEPSPLWAAWEATAAAQPAGVAVIDARAGGQIWSFAELDALARHWAARLHEAGANRGVVVGIPAPNSVHWLGAFLGTQALGAVALPLEEGMVAEALAEVPAVLATPHPQRLGGHRHKRGLCLIKTTSGTTGQPRSLGFTAAQMMADGEAIIAAMGLLADDRNLAVIPFGHSYGLGNLVLPLILRGIGIVIGGGFFPEEILRDLRAHGATVLPVVPPLIRSLAATTGRVGDSLRLVISAGGMLPASAREAFFKTHGLPVANFYGSTETGGISFDPGDAGEQTPGLIGRPLPGVRVTREAATGRLLVSGPAVVTRGHRVRRDGFGCVRLADLGEVRSDGTLVLRGRVDREVKIAGRRLRLGDIEHAAEQLPGVRAAFAQMRATEGGDCEGRLGLVVAGAVEAADVRTALVKRLPLWARPKKIVVLGEMPLTARGKWCRATLGRLLA